MKFIISLFCGMSFLGMTTANPVPGFHADLEQLGERSYGGYEAGPQNQGNPEGYFEGDLQLSNEQQEQVFQGAIQQDQLERTSPSTAAPPSLKWSHWSPWTPCHVSTCGGCGKKFRGRVCMDPPCNGVSFKMKACNFSPCYSCSSYNVNCPCCAGFSLLRGKCRPA